jgi:hypothetical protein
MRAGISCAKAQSGSLTAYVGKNILYKGAARQFDYTSQGRCMPRFTGLTREMPQQNSRATRTRHGVVAMGEANSPDA